MKTQATFNKTKHCWIQQYDDNTNEKIASIITNNTYWKAYI